MTQWNVGIQNKLFNEFILDVAYVGSKSTDLLRQVQINAVPFGATFLPQNQDPTRAPSALPGANALPNDLLRPYQGYGNIRMWDYSGYGNYHSLQTRLNRRFDSGFMCLVLLRLEQGAGHQQHRLRRRRAESRPRKTAALDYGLVDYDRPHNFVDQLHLPGAER